jgi:hypothetical protein
MAKCPSCQEETSRKINELKPNQMMIKMMEKMNISEKNREKEKVVCIEHDEKIIFHQKNINLIGCH